MVLISLIVGVGLSIIYWLLRPLIYKKQAFNKLQNNIVVEEFFDDYLSKVVKEMLKLIEKTKD